jgi:DNA polymerase III epsilon subunit-like protein
MREDGRRRPRRVGLLSVLSCQPLFSPWLCCAHRDFNTRFSGITQEMYSTSALQPLADIRSSLDEIISSETILIGHALENDLKTLRMIHFRNVDTAIVFRHPAWTPYRRALRDLYVPSLIIKPLSWDT